MTKILSFAGVLSTAGFLLLFAYCKNNSDSSTAATALKPSVFMPELHSPPRPEKKPKTLVSGFGDQRIDDYYWLNERENPAVTAYLARRFPFDRPSGAERSGDDRGLPALDRRAGLSKGSLRSAGRRRSLDRSNGGASGAVSAGESPPPASGRLSGPGYQGGL